MRILIGSYSGSIGKSTLAKELFQPRLKNSRIINIESINSGHATVDEHGNKLETLTFREFEKLQGDLAFAGEDENLILDVGASNIEGLMNEMKTFVGSGGDIDLWVVPVLGEQRFIDDALSFINVLVNLLNVDPSRIVVIMNRIDPNWKADKMAIFRPLLEKLNQVGARMVTKPVLVSPAYMYATLFDMRIADLAAQDEAQWRERGRKEPHNQERIKKMLVAIRASIGTNKDLNEVFSQIEFPAEVVA